MLSHDKPQFRPQKSLTDRIAKWLTLSTFAWFLAVVLVGILAFLAVKGAEKLSDNGYPYTLVAMDGKTLDLSLRDMPAKNAVVLLFNAKCGDLCDKQIDTLLNLRPMEENGSLRLLLIALDDDPLATMRYLESIDFPQSMRVYYTAPAARAQLLQTLERIGSGTARKMAYPHSMIIAKPRKFIVEYQGYIRSQEIMRTIRLHNMAMPQGGGSR